MLCQNCENARGTILTTFEGLDYIVCEDCYIVLQDILLEGGFDCDEDEDLF